MKKPEKNKEKIPFKKKKSKKVNKKAVLSSDSTRDSRTQPRKKKKKIKLPLDDLTSLPSEEEFGNEFH